MNKHLYTLQEISFEDWTPWTYLELAKKEKLFQFPSRISALAHCMGVRYGERFIDYDKKVCHFDSEEFRSILEQCAELESVEMPMVYSSPNLPEADYMMDSCQLNSTASYLDTETWQGKVYWVGFPGWEGMENDLYPDEAFAINSLSPHKEGAWDFLEFLLSRELQERITWGFPSRKDSFETSLYSSYQPNGTHRAEFGGTVRFGYRDPVEEDFATI